MVRGETIPPQTKISRLNPDITITMYNSENFDKLLWQLNLDEILTMHCRHHKMLKFLISSKLRKNHYAKLVHVLYMCTCIYMCIYTCICTVIPYNETSFVF